MKRISFIVISKDSEETLARCLNSIESLSLENDQKILVLNNSNSATRKIAQKFTDSWTVVEETRPGPAFARNCGASLAKNELLYFIDSDIELSQNWRALIEEQFSRPWTMAGQVKINFEKASYPYIWIKRILSSYGKRRLYFAMSDKRQALITDIFLDSASLITRRTWFEQLQGFDTHYRYHEDSHFTLRTLREGGDIFCEDRTFNLEIADRTDGIAKFISSIYLAAHQFPDLAREFSVDIHLPFYSPMKLSLAPFRRILHCFIYRSAQLIQLLGMTSGSPMVLTHRSSIRNIRNEKKFYLMGTDPFVRSYWVGAKEKRYDLRKRRWISTQ